MSDLKPVVAIAGVRGFIGTELIGSLAGKYRIIGLTRSVPKEETPGVEWRQCDLFSLKQAEAALSGADFAVYLVHSMLPQARLTQAAFDDLDLLCADNFARAARDNGVKRIIYLGGIIPQRDALSDHLRSRKEVEDTLASRGVPVTALRAGLIFGWRGTSFQILLRLVCRLPFMLCPRWTRNYTQPAVLSDVLQAIEYCLAESGTAGRTYDLASTPPLSYAEMMIRTARFLGRKLKAVPVPFLSPGLSVLWVRLITGAKRQLIRPLVESLRYPMVTQNERRLILPCRSLRPYEDVLAEALAGHHPGEPYSFGSKPPGEKDVRSVQRLPLPEGWSAWDVASEYVRWLKRAMAPFFRVTTTEKSEWIFSLRGLNVQLLLLRFSQERSTPDRPIFYITGGVLAHEVLSDRLEFREVLNRRFVLAAIHDFKPRLPWLLYLVTQAVIHRIVMSRFGKHLQKACLKKYPPPAHHLPKL